MLWRVLISALIEYPENSFYHTVFYRIFVEIAHSHHEPLLKVRVDPPV